MPPITTTEFIEQCTWVYKQFLADAVLENDVPVWEGTITKWFTKRKISTDRYSRIMQALKAMDCIRVVNQGNRYSESQLSLHGEPSIARYVQAQSDGSFDRTAGRIKKATEQQWKHDTLQRISKLERQVEILMEARDEVRLHPIAETS